MLPLDVFIAFTEFAKKYSGTGLGKFDYGVALRILLEKSKMDDRISELEDQLTIMEMRMKEPVKEVIDIPLTFGSSEKEVEYE